MKYEWMKMVQILAELLEINQKCSIYEHHEIMWESFHILIKGILKIFSCSAAFLFLTHSHLISLRR